VESVFRRFFRPDGLFNCVRLPWQFAADCPDEKDFPAKPDLRPLYFPVSRLPFTVHMEKWNIQVNRNGMYIPYSVPGTPPGNSPAYKIRITGYKKIFDASFFFRRSFSIAFPVYPGIKDR
jgi:hypothetical protein